MSLAKKKGSNSSNRFLSNTERTSNRFIFDKKFLLTLGYIFYVTLLILSRMPNLAEEVTDSYLQDSYEYHITFSEDGWFEHCYIERHNVSRYAKMDIKYTKSTNTLEVACSNLKVIQLDLRSLFEEESERLFGISIRDNSNYYKWYLIENDHLNVNIDTDNKISNLTFKDTPIPYEVRVNGEKWHEHSNYYFNPAKGMIITNIPEGYNSVDIYFKSPDTQVPIAKLKAERETLFCGEYAFLSGNDSYDPDGFNLQFFWDLGDGTFIIDKSFIHHKYDNSGTFGVILTVRDDDQLIAHAYLNLTVLNSSRPCFSGRIPNQIYDEDSPPWQLDLSIYEPRGNYSNNNFKWYVTGEDESLYTIMGENSTNDILIFSPEKNAFGSDKIRIWMTDNENILIYQDVWINLTPVNDPPLLNNPPDLIIQYNAPYRFNYEPYIIDVDTPLENLVLTTSDTPHTMIEGINVTYLYPKDFFLKDNLYVILTVNDGDNYCQDLINIKVIDGVIPQLKEELPDININEGETYYYHLNLFDYFSMIDFGCKFQVAGAQKVNIIIHDNFTVTIKAPHDWNGKELITIRAIKESGAFVEDSFRVNVLSKNDPPTIAAIPKIVVHYDLDYFFNLKYYVADEDNELNLLDISTSDPAHIKIDQGDYPMLILNYPWQENLPYTERVTLYVSDGMYQINQNFQVIVSANHPPQLLNQLPDITFLEDTELENAFNIFNYFIDEDGDNLFFNLDTEILDISLTTEGRLELKAPQDWFGVTMVTVTVHDDAEICAFYQTDFNVYVIPVNDEPVIAEIPGIKLNVSETVKINLIPYISDVDNELYELVLMLNESDADAEIYGFDLVVYGNKSYTGRIQLELSDGINKTDQIVFISIQEKDSLSSDQSALYWTAVGFIVVLLISSLILIHRRYNGKYKVSETFLIHKNGCLIKHSTTDINSRNSDEADIVGSMFTAVRDFIEDSFSNGNGQVNEWSLKRMEFGENNVFIEQGKYVFLAVIFTGIPGKKLSRKAKKIVKNAEDEYGIVFNNWNGCLDYFNNLKIEMK